MTEYLIKPKYRVRKVFPLDKIGSEEALKIAAKDFYDKHSTIYCIIEAITCNDGIYLKLRI